MKTNCLSIIVVVNMMCLNMLFAQADLDPSDYGDLVFKSGFETSSQVTNIPKNDKKQMMTGTDFESGYDWEDFTSQFHSAEFFYLAGKNGVESHKAYAEAQILNSVGYNGSKGMLFEVKEDYPNDNEQSRVEYWMYPKTESNGLFSNQGYARYKMKLDRNLKAIWPSHWINIFESKQGVYPNRNYRFYITIDKKKDKKNPKWCFVRHNTQTDKSVIIDNTEVEVPIDEWFTVAFFWKKHKTEGRLFFEVNGQVVFDFVGEMEHPDHPENTDFWSPIKNYRSREWHEGAASSKIWYDDLELWSGFPRKNKIPSFEAPNNVVSGNSYSFEIQTLTSEKRKIQIRLQDVNDNFKSYASLNFFAEKGLNNYTKTVIIDKLASEGDHYQWNAILTTENGEWSDRLDHVTIPMVNVIEPSLSTKTLNLKNGFIIHPNPVINSLSIKSETTFDSVSIYDISGKKLKEIFSPSSIALEIDFKDFSKGIYFVGLKSNDTQRIKKIIKN